MARVRENRWRLPVCRAPLFLLFERQKRAGVPQIDAFGGRVYGMPIDLVAIIALGVTVVDVTAAIGMTSLLGIATITLGLGRYAGISCLVSQLDS